jgi:hypothetical protein
VFRPCSTLPSLVTEGDPWTVVGSGSSSDPWGTVTEDKRTAQAQPPLQVLSMSSVAQNDSTFRALGAFPGPLRGLAPGTVTEWLFESSYDAQGSRDCAQSPGTVATLPSDSGRRLLHSVIAALIAHRGEFDATTGSKPSVEGIERVDATDFDTFTRASPADTAVALLRLDQAFDAESTVPRVPESTYIPSTTSGEAGYDDAEGCVSCGDPKGAALALAAAGRWAESLLLASSDGPETFRAVSRAFVASAVPGHRPLRSVLATVAGGVRAGLTSDLLGESQRSAAQANEAQALKEWRVHAELLLTARGQSLRSGVLDLSDRLWHEGGSPEAAQALLLLCGAGVQADQPGARLVLLGADHLAARAYFRRSIRAWQLTEAFEFAQQQRNPQATLAVVHPFRLLYAMTLADWGLLDQALRYVTLTRAAVEDVIATSGSAKPVFHASFMSSLREFQHRLESLCGKSSPAPAVSSARPLAKPAPSRPSTVVPPSVPSPPVASVPDPPTLATPLSASDKPLPVSDKPLLASDKSEDSNSSSSFGISLLSSGLSGLRSMFLPKNASLIQFDAPPDAGQKTYYDEKLKKWVTPGQQAPPPPPPPPTALPTAPQVSSLLAPTEDGPISALGGPSTRGKRGKVASRYVNTFGNGSAPSPAPTSAPKRRAPPASTFNPAAFQS